jgi:hypothetical protein
MIYNLHMLYKTNSNNKEEIWYSLIPKESFQFFESFLDFGQAISSSVLSMFSKFFCAKNISNHEFGTLICTSSVLAKSKL